MDNNNIEALERRYQALFSDYQAGTIEEATFIAGVDQLQFQDAWGRYWMIGAQSGTWHYYDGQAWHQADPREADSLPFMDEQGRYWQRGVKSGDWYYYNSETKEWVKPDPQGDSRPVPVLGREGSKPRRPSSTSYQTPSYQPSAEAGSTAPQFDGELFQDDEGRYWAVGTKTGQWYFYDETGWHPAQEFQSGGASPYPPTQPYQPVQPAPGYPNQPYYSQPPQTFYQPNQDPWAAQGYVQSPYPPAPQPVAGYAYPSQQPVYQQPAPAPQPSQTYAAQYPAGQPPQAYTAPPQPQSITPPPAQTEAPTQPVSREPDAAKAPPPPDGESQSGSWFYFDGKQWLKYSSGEPAEAPPSSPKMVIDQESKPAVEPKAAKPKAESKSQPVVAEFIEEDEPPVEVVDVEVITVIDPEPEVEPEPAPRPTKERSASTPLAQVDEIEPRRPRRPSEAVRSQPAPSEPQKQTRDRMPTDPGRPYAPKQREAGYEPGVVIPTGAAPSSISAPAGARTGSRPVQAQPRRMRENTAPMEPVSPQNVGAAPAPDRRSVTQPMPQVSAAQAARSDTMPMPAQQARKEPAPTHISAAAAASQPSAAPQPKKTGYTVGDVLRAFPSTFWTAAGGVVLLIIFAVIIIGAWALFNGGENTGVGGVAAIQSPTPTLAAGPPNATPTLGPTPTNSPEPVTTPTEFSLTSFSNPALGFSLDYPKGWQKKEGKDAVAFSPSADGLDPAKLKDIAMRIGVPTNEKAAIADLLTEVLSDFPTDAKTLNEGTISIASQTWTSTQIRFKNEDLGGEGIATLAVTSKDGTGYYLVAVAPAEKWNPTQPIFQEMINSFRFTGKGVAVAQATTAVSGTTSVTTTPAISSSTPAAKAGTATKQSATVEATSAAAPSATPTPKVTATPLVYVVQQGDSLLEIANKFGVDVDELATKNDITDPGKLSLGQELIIPFTAEELAAYNSGDASGGSSSAAAEEAESAGAEKPASAGTPVAAGAAASTPEEEKEAEAPASSGSPAAVSGRIVYPAFNLGTNSFDLWLADVATGEQTLIADGASQPAFNKDGSLLAYRSWNLDTRGIFFRDFIGGRGGMVTRFVEDGLPTWSPDGSSFAFATRREGDRVPRVYRGTQEGKNDFSLNFQGEYPSTLPDGRVVAKGCLPSGDCGVFIIGPNGGGETKISTEPSDTAPAPSPDGRKIAFMSSGRGGTNWEIWVMNVDGSNPVRLTQNGNNDGLPTWSPDGKSIAYLSDAEGAWSVWVMNADGSNQRRLFNLKGSPDGVVLRDRDNSKGWLEERISWAP